MQSPANYLAIDLGASGGRAILVRFDGLTFSPTEVHRFENKPLQSGGGLFWDVATLFEEIKTGLRRCSEQGHHLSSIAIDTWGVDFALLAPSGELLDRPRHYRDPRNAPAMEQALQLVPREQIYESTGIQFMPLNTLFQLFAAARAPERLLDSASDLLFIPDLFNYWLTIEQRCEYTHATTTQIYNPVKKTWDEDIIETVGLPLDIFPQVVQPGTILGSMKNINVTTPASHDTGSAVAAVPTKAKEFCYISSGTWSLLGTELASPVINDKVYEQNFTNEGGVGGTTRLLRNLPGLWFEQELLREWVSKGAAVNYDDMQTMASVSVPFKSFIDPWDASFLAPGEMTPRIVQFCRSTGQHEPMSMGEHIRCVYDSLAVLYRHALKQLESITGTEYTYIHVIGGGSRNKVMNQFTADATGRTVIAGPVEATALGNAIMQLRGIGILTDVWEARELLKETLDLEYYHSQSGADWDTAYTRFMELIPQ